jgi:hypothetical protein
MWVCELNSAASGSCIMAGACEHGCEPSGLIQGREFPDRLSHWEGLSSIKPRFLFRNYPIRISVGSSDIQTEIFLVLSQFMWLPRQYLLTRHDCPLPSSHLLTIHNYFNRCCTYNLRSWRISLLPIVSSEQASSERGLRFQPPPPLKLWRVGNRPDKMLLLVERNVLEMTA